MPGGLLNRLRESYDRVAAAYAAHIGGELAGKPIDRRLLDALADRVRTGAPGAGGVVGDLGCGTGHVAAYLAARSVAVVGVDLSPGMLAQAPPGLPVAAGDLRALPLADGALAAAIAFYSLIHLPPGTEVAALAEIRRAVRSGGLLLAAVHVGTEVRHLDEWWGEPVSVDFRFFRVAELTGWLQRAGWAVEDVLEREPYVGVEVDTRRAYVTAVSPGSAGTRRGSGRP